MNGEAWPNDLAAYNSEHPTIETYAGGYHSRTGNAAGKSYATTTGYYLKKFCNADQILRARSGVCSYYLSSRLAHLPYGRYVFELC